MGSQTSSTNAGVEVASHAAYGSDLGSTMDLSNGKVYRITGAGNVVEYANLSGYLGNTGAATIATAVFTGNFVLNGFSYDGAGGFYGTVAGASATNSGDTLRWSTLANVLTNTTSSVTDTGYGGNLFNFFDPDETATTAANGLGIYTAGDPFTAQYYQSAGNGRLEGWDTLALYGDPNNRGEFTGTNVFGGSTTAWGTGVDAAAAFAIPEPSISLLGGLGLFGLLRRRRA